MKRFIPWILLRLSIRGRRRCSPVCGVVLTLRASARSCRFAVSDSVGRPLVRSWYSPLLARSWSGKISAGRLESLLQLESLDASLFVEITDPTMGFQLLDLFARKPASVSYPAVPFHIPHRTHSRNDGGNGRVA